MLRFILLIYLFSIASESYSQISADSARGEVGDEISVRITIPVSIVKDGLNNLNWKIFITNPTVFYPDSINIMGEHKLLKSDTIRVNDSVWNFNIEFQKPADYSDNVIINFFGEALAGSDSISVLKFTDVKLNNSPQNDFEAVVVTHTSGTPLPYIRFATLHQNFPNPVEEGKGTTWNYVIDKPSIVEFYIIDYRGKETFLVDLGKQSIGIHEYYFTPDMGFSSGLYWMKLKTNTGESLKPFIIVK